MQPAFRGLLCVCALFKYLSSLSKPFTFWFCKWVFNIFLLYFPRVCAQGLQSCLAIPACESETQLTSTLEIQVREKKKANRLIRIWGYEIHYLQDLSHNNVLPQILYDHLDYCVHQKALNVTQQLFLCNYVISPAGLMLEEIRPTYKRLCAT